MLKSISNSKVLVALHHGARGSDGNPNLYAFVCSSGVHSKGLDSRNRQLQELMQALRSNFPDSTSSSRLGEGKFTLDFLQPLFPRVHVPQFLLQRLDLVLECHSPDTISDERFGSGTYGGKTFEAKNLLFRSTNGGEFPLAFFPSQSQQEVVVLEERWTMGDCDEGYRRKERGTTLSATNDVCLVGRVDVLIPRSLACWYISPSTSVLTALVHSSKTPYLGRW